ncbi:hypothetical protein T4C_9516 [Trichinella pseudospiralis]|uniref:Uncharacterized protein n=1 Tax=Trichinella pseudospiralis TaxID=6337 RepID=A0A0V1GG08_TRIPS|nr:hypothetical protein T4C_9516 [Trichinella pseudospiralis]
MPLHMYGCPSHTLGTCPRPDDQELPTCFATHVADALTPSMVGIGKLCNDISLQNVLNGYLSRNVPPGAGGTGNVLCDL